VVKVHAGGSTTAVRALSGISLDIARGAYVAIVGESGSGKTTLMHLLGGLDRPTSGSVIIDGLDIGSASRAQLKRLRASRIGFVFQGSTSSRRSMRSKMWCCRRATPGSIPSGHVNARSGC